MATTLAGVSLSSTRGVVVRADSSNKNQKIGISPCFVSFNHPWRMNMKQRNFGGMVVRTAPEKISEKVEESIKSAEQVCAEDATTGECAAAWDEVEEVSAAASHARQKQKDSDPLETFCKDNPETDECRTYED